MDEIPKVEAAWLENLEYVGPSYCHSPAWIWQPFFRSDTLARLNESLKMWVASQDFGHGPFNDLGSKLPPDWPKGRSNLYARVEQGHFCASAMAIYETSGAEGLENVIPAMHRNDVRHPLTIQRVLAWPDKLQATVCVTYGNLEFGFYDTGWMLHFHRYTAGRQLEFSLVGLAHEAYSCASRIVELIEPPWLQAQIDRDADYPFTLNTLGQRVVKVDHSRTQCFCSTIESTHTYEFSGTIKELKVLPNLFGQPAWLAVVTVESDIEALGNLVGPLDLDIVITQEIWGDAPPPAVGEDIEGELWLQGCVTGL